MNLEIAAVDTGRTVRWYEERLEGQREGRFVKNSRPTADILKCNGP